MQMNELLRKNLILLVQKHGKSLCREPVRCEGLLRDLCPGNSREIAVLVAALRQQVGIDLLSPPTSVSREYHLHALSRRLYDNQGICDQFAWWAVVSWALALGVITQEGEVKPPRELTRVQKISDKGKGRVTTSLPPSLIVASDGSGQAKTIGEALEKAPNNTQIFIRPGRYRESLTISSSLQLIGEGRPSEVIIEGVHAPCLTLRAPTCLIHGLTLEQKNPSAADTHAAALTFLRGQAIVEDCTLVSAGVGVAICGGRADPIMRRCNILGSGEKGILIERAKGLIESCRIEGPVRGIVVKGKTGVTIRACSIFHGHIGIEVIDRGYALIEKCTITDQAYASLAIQGGSQPAVRGCSCMHAQFGVEATDRAKGSLEQCTVDGCAQGILISERADPTLTACTIHHNQFGVRVTSAGKGTIQNSDISENEFAGISIKEGGNPRVSGCRIGRNGDVGIWIQKSGLGTIEGNDLRGNRKGGISLEEGSRARAQKNLL